MKYQPVVDMEDSEYPSTDVPESSQGNPPDNNSPHDSIAITTVTTTTTGMQQGTLHLESTNLSTFSSLGLQPPSIPRPIRSIWTYVFDRIPTQLQPWKLNNRIDVGHRNHHQALLVNDKEIEDKDEDEAKNSEAEKETSRPSLVSESLSRDLAEEMVWDEHHQVMSQLMLSYGFIHCTVVMDKELNLKLTHWCSDIYVHGTLELASFAEIGMSALTSGEKRRLIKHGRKARYRLTDIQTASKRLDNPISNYPVHDEYANSLVNQAYNDPHGIVSYKDYHFQSLQYYSQFLLPHKVFCRIPDPLNFDRICDHLLPPTRILRLYNLHYFLHRLFTNIFPILLHSTFHYFQLIQPVHSRDFESVCCPWSLMQWTRICHRTARIRGTTNLEHQYFSKVDWGIEERSSRLYPRAFSDRSRSNVYPLGEITQDPVQL